MKKKQKKETDYFEIFENKTINNKTKTNIGMQFNLFHLELGILEYGVLGLVLSVGLLCRYGSSFWPLLLKQPVTTNSKASVPDPSTALCSRCAPLLSQLQLTIHLHFSGVFESK
jgi:hypothetical protein